MNRFEGVLRAFPPIRHTIQKLDTTQLARDVKDRFSVEVPAALIEFWTFVGAGYFGERELCIFGERRLEGGRDSLLEWNSSELWLGVFPPARQGGPLFFAETCFGEQIGFRWESNNCIPILFSVDTYESFVIGESVAAALEKTLADRSLVEQDRVREIKRRLGELSFGMHFAPIVSPLVGGSSSPDNFDVVPAHLHFRTAVALHESLRPG